jgi:predicted Zn-dependent protease
MIPSKIRHLYLVWVPILTIWIGGCVSPLDENFNLELEQDVTIAEPDQEPTEHKKGEVIKPLDKPMYVEAPGHVGLLILPEQAAGNLKIRLKPIQNWGGAPFDKKSDDVLNEVVARVVDFQTQISRRRYEDALTTVTDLQTKYPNIRYLSFLKASCLYLLKRNDSALESLREGLNAFPENKSGLALFKMISGKDFTR